MTALRTIAKASGLLAAVRKVREIYRVRSRAGLMLKYLLPEEERRPFLVTFDPVRYGALSLALRRIALENIPGHLAEVGVFKGYTSAFLHAAAPDRRLILFDTFQGFDERDSVSPGDTRFRDTSVDAVARVLGDTRNVEFRKGYFPDTAAGLEHERFALIMLDADLFEPTLAGLEFFYPRVSPGGYIFVHDYNSNESDYAVSRAVSRFLADKPERPVEIPDIAGSVLLRKLS